ncbi:MAG TPA: YeeE/YedE family protein [Burkholderiales bacterium]|nr:YeeE/YedE family protein [Burkholderiales bacterium]
MESAIHWLVLGLAFAVALVLGAVAAKTNFCTMGAVSDWVNMGDTGRMRAWWLAIAVAISGVVALQAAGIATLPENTLPPYRTAEFAWLRYILGGLMLGIGMTLASGCPSRTLLRIGGGNLKSVVVFLVLGGVVYLMFATPIFNLAFMSWIRPVSLDLSRFGIAGQDLGAVAAGLVGADLSAARLWAGAALALLVYALVFRSRQFRGDFDNILGGTAVGLAVAAGWAITAGPLGVEWLEYASFAIERPIRVGAQSLTFVGPVGDTVRYLSEPAHFTLISFGVATVFGVILGALLYSVASGNFRIEWFASWQDFASHVAGGVLMGFGGFLAMGCTIGQGVTGASTLALGSYLALGSMMLGSAITMKVQYHLLDEQGFWRALWLGLADLKLAPAPKATSA